MSKRNFILLIIIVILMLVGAFVYFSSTKTPTTPGTAEGGTNFFSRFNPFKANQPTPTTTGTPPTDISGYVPPSDTTETQTKLRKVSSMPIAGYGVFVKERYKDVSALISEQVKQETPLVKPPTKKPTPPPTEFVTALRYVDRATGNIYQTFADKINEQKFSSTVIPKIYEANFGDKSESVIFRYLKEDKITIETFAGSLPKETFGGDSVSANTLTGSFLPENITGMSVSPDLKKIFYLLEVGDNVFGITSGPTGDKKNQVFSSAFTEWLPQWPNTNLITLTTKPSANIPGYMYAIDPNKKDLKKVFGNINGLTTLTSPDGKLVLYGDDKLSLGIYNINTKNFTALGTRTLPEKCVWGKTNIKIYCAVPITPINDLYPDSWYKGETSFSDEIWEIDAASGYTTILINPIESAEGEDIDAVKLMLDKDQNYLFFVNKKNSYLWELQLN